MQSRRMRDADSRWMFGALLATVLKPEAAHEWLNSRNTSMAQKIPAAVLRVGEAENVLAQVEALAGGGTR